MIIIRAPLLPVVPRATNRVAGAGHAVGRVLYELNLAIEIHARVFRFHDFNLNQVRLRLGVIVPGSHWVVLCRFLCF